MFPHNLEGGISIGWLSIWAQVWKEGEVERKTSATFEMCTNSTLGGNSRWLPAVSHPGSHTPDLDFLSFSIAGACFRCLLFMLWVPIQPQTVTCLPTAWSGATLADQISRHILDQIPSYETPGFSEASILPPVMFVSSSQNPTQPWELQK